MIEENKQRQAIRRLLDALTDDVISVSSEQLLADLIDSGQDINALATRFDIILERATHISAKLATLHGASSEVQVHDSDHARGHQQEWRARTDGKRAKSETPPRESGR